jgi:hypothetical protein
MRRDHVLLTLESGCGSGDEKISKQVLVQRLRAMQGGAMHQSATSARLDIPKWLERYGQCFDVVDTVAQGLPLPRWFSAEIEPPPAELTSSCDGAAAAASSPPLSSLLPPPVPKP